MKRRMIVSCLLAGVLLLAGMASNSSAAPPERRSYIVVLDSSTPDVAATAAEFGRRSGGSVGLIYRTALKGFSISATAQGIAAIAGSPRVAYIEADRVVSIAGQEVPTGVPRTFATENTSLKIDGLDDRVAVNVAVIDTGIDHNHPDLNVGNGVNCAGGSPLRGSCTSGLPGDDNGHGTHVAGTIGAIDNGLGVVGIAPGAVVHPVKVLRGDGSGYLSWIVAGIDWVAANAGEIEVANMSLGGAGYSQAEYDAIEGAVKKGVAFAVAAGNSDADAAGYSPAAFSNVLTVSALADFDGLPGGKHAGETCRPDQDDTLADFSNWGEVVDIAAPGVCILSTWPGGGYNTISGTSMASPHAAGGLAILASTSNPANKTDVEALYQQLRVSGNADWIDDSGDGVKEPLLDVAGFTASLTTEEEPSPSPSSISLTVTAKKYKSQKYADLTWGGAGGTSVDIYRDGAVVADDTENDGAHTDGPLGKGGGSATYKVCEATGSPCSPEVTVTW